MRGSEDVLQKRLGCLKGVPKIDSVSPYVGESDFSEEVL